MKTCEELLQANRYDAACFYSHQVAEKAVKSAIYFKDENSFVKVAKLLTSFETVQILYLGSGFQIAIVKAIKDLDKYFEITRYPSVYSGNIEVVAPSQHFTQQQASQAFQQAQTILQFFKDLIKKSK